MRGIIRSHTHQERINTLFLRIKSRLPELEELAHDLKETEEDGVYRFYHGSNKVFFLQDPVKEAFTLINEIGGESDPPNFEYARIVEAETARQKVKLHQRIAEIDLPSGAAARGQRWPHLQPIRNPADDSSERKKRPNRSTKAV